MNEAVPWNDEEEFSYANLQSEIEDAHRIAEELELSLDQIIAAANRYGDPEFDAALTAARKIRR